jgi:hypothetical protein
VVWKGRECWFGLGWVGLQDFHTLFGTRDRFYKITCSPQNKHLDEEGPQSNKQLLQRIFPGYCTFKTFVNNLYYHLCFCNQSCV